MFISKCGFHIGDFRIWRSKHKAPFSKREVKILSLLKPYFEESLSDKAPFLPLLTAKELEVVKFLPSGFSDKEIAREMAISSTTIRTHINSAMHKLNCKNRTQLAVLLSRHTS
ncbi:response regulator transcription factor [Marinomonas spartinae]|nr:response regulator transcription factor [Marinomonas spartinae]